MLYSQLVVTLSNQENETTDLVYQLQDSKAAQIWARCIKKAQQDKLDETDRFYGFDHHKKSNLDFLLRELEDIISQLKKRHPEIQFPQIQKEDLRSSINRLHYEFAHSHHVTQKINSENESLWAAFNVNLHAIENVLTHEKVIKKTGLGMSRIVFTWQKPHSVEIPDDCYSDFTHGLEFGTAYINYSQVGRHFFELYYAKDDQLDDAHIRPFRYISADTHLYFGPSNSAESVQKVGKKMELWFEERKARFNRLGFFWGDPKLAIGYLPVAKLQNLPHGKEEIIRFLARLGKFNKLVAADVL